MKARFMRLLKATFATVLILAVFFLSLTRTVGQTNNPPSAALDSGALPGLFARVGMIGASVTAGYATTNMPGDSNGQLCRLDHYFDTAVTTPHEPAQNFGSPFFFMNVEKTAQSQIDSVLKMKPTLVVGADFLFWFCYGNRLTEPQRLELFDRGLKMLEAIPCPMVLGDIPDVSTATNGILSVGEVPVPATMQEANRRLRSWAATRPLVSVLNLSSFMQNIGAGQGIVIHGAEIPSDQTRRVLQPDRLHLMPSGCSILTLAILDSLPSSATEGHVHWNAGELERQTIAAINKSWPEVTTTGTIFNAYKAPIGGVSFNIFPPIAAFLTRPSDAQGNYSIIWRPNLPAQLFSGQPFVLARDVEHNWAAFFKANTNNAKLDIDLLPGLTLSGMLKDAANGPLTHATVQIALSEEGKTYVVSNLVLDLNGQGTFAVRALPQNRSYQISAAAPGHGRATISLSAEQTQTNLLDLAPIVLKTANLPVGGLVLSSDNVPCADATIAIADPNQPARPPARSDAGGRFVLQGVCEGPLTLRVSWTGTNKAQLTAIFEAKAGDTNVIIDLQKAPLMGFPHPALNK